MIETWDETKPQGSRSRALGDDDIREFKRAIRERLAVDHCAYDDESGHGDVGYHNKCTLVEQASAPTAVANAGIVYTKDVSGATELFYRDAAGNEIQLTSSGVLSGLGSTAWRTGDKILSSNTNTPTGWTDVSSTYTDKFIRISSSTPLTTGGSDTHNHGGATASHTLTEAQIPSHTHSLVGYNDATTVGSYVTLTATTTGTTLATGATGGGGGHTHNISSADNIPAYVQMKMYSKT